MKTYPGRVLSLFAFFAMCCAMPIRAESEPVTAGPEFTEQYVMLYYRDISAAAEFYGGVLGLPAVMDDEWVKLYQVLPGSLIGVVKEGGTAWHKAQAESAVMVSIVTTDVDAWYRIIKQKPEIEILKEIYTHDSVPMRAFLMADPGGYSVEIFQWLK